MLGEAGQSQPSLRCSPARSLPSQAQSKDGPPPKRRGRTLIGVPKADLLVSALMRRGLAATVEDSGVFIGPSSSPATVVRLNGMSAAWIELREGDSTVHCTDIETSVLLREALLEQLAD